MLVSAATGHKVVSVSSAETVGKVEHFLIDPRSKAVVALELKKTDHGSVLRWTDLASFGVDAVTVADAGRIGEPDDGLTQLADKHHRPLGKRVLSSVGDELGKVDDIDFDLGTGAVTALVVGAQRIDGQRLIGIGSWAVVVGAESPPGPRRGSGSTPAA